MYRTKQDFLADWTFAAEGTKRVLEALTDEKLNQSIIEGHSTLGWLGWHVTTSPLFFGGQAGLNIPPVGGQEIPKKASEIAEAYRKTSEAVKNETEQTLSDEKMLETVEFLGQEMPRGAVLRSMIDHQTHHRGQMTVLLRQAGLSVPGVMGPTKEEQQG